MPRKRTSRIYARTRGDTTRFYGDFRDYSDVGGRLEALVAPGEHSATTDKDIAGELATQRVRELEAKRRGKTLIGTLRSETLGAFAATHLKNKAEGIRRGKITKSWVENVELHLEDAIDFFGAGKDVASITVDDVEQYRDHLELLPSGRGEDEYGEPKTLSPGTQRKYLNSLSNLFRYAQAKSVVPPAHNPVSSMMDKPTSAEHEPAWLEVPQAALLLESARTASSSRSVHVNPAMYEMIATLLLTGGREREVLGLDLEDISFDRKTIRFRPNQHRRLKTRTSHRTVRMWPQLEEILRPYVFGGDGPRSGLLFRSPKTGGMVRDLRKSLDYIGGRIGYEPGEIRSKMFRHTYCSARLQTLDRGEPVAEFTVVKEMGHGGSGLVRRVYGHLGTIGQRSEFVEYRTEHYMEKMGELVADLRTGG